jgi:hypothetical protein
MRPTTSNPQAKASFSSFGVARQRHGPLPINTTGDRPMTMTEFIYKLYKDELFRNYYNQLFIFLNQVATGKFLRN